MKEAELSRRRAFLELSDGDLAHLAALRPFAEKHVDGIVASFYEFLALQPETKTFLPDDATVHRLQVTQRAYFLRIFEGRCDVDYLENRLRVGVTHERIGLSMEWYLGGYRKYLQLIEDHLLAELRDETRVREALRVIQKIVFFDIAVACDTYLTAKIATIERQQAAIRELTAPVIAVHSRVLLLPLVGAVDAHRADQILEDVLSKVVHASARCLIIDIAGVPALDTNVADSLLRLASAVRLLGAETVLTGVSPQAARTIVHLGVDLSAMHTTSGLSDGIQLALSLLEKPTSAKALGAASTMR